MHYRFRKKIKRPLKPISQQNNVPNASSRWATKVFKVCVNVTSSAKQCTKYTLVWFHLLHVTTKRCLVASAPQRHSPVGQGSHTSRRNDSCGENAPAGLVHGRQPHAFSCIPWLKDNRVCVTLASNNPLYSLNLICKPIFYDFFVCFLMEFVCLHNSWKQFRINVNKPWDLLHNYMLMYLWFKILAITWFTQLWN